MKAIKLIGILVVLVGAIVLALNWKSIFSNTSGGEQLPAEDKIDITAECKKISDSWAAHDSWNDSLYQAQRTDIDQSKNMKLLSAEGYNTVNNRLREEAANKVEEGYNKALKASPFNEAGLLRNYQGAQTLATAEEMNNDSRVSHIIKLQDLYNKIKAFVNSNHAITPNFNGNSWTPFDQLQGKILAQARQLRGNPLYNELAHLPKFKDGLDEGKLKAKTDGYKRNFYDTLEAQIERHFNSKVQNESNKNLLDNILNQLEKQDYTSSKKLAYYIVYYWE